jgi:hypothetical protein
LAKYGLFEKSLEVSVFSRRSQLFGPARMRDKAEDGNLQEESITFSRMALSEVTSPKSKYATA